MMSKSDRELEQTLIAAAGELKAPPKSPVLKKRHAVAQANKTATRWALNQFDLVRLAAALHERGAGLEWHVATLVSIANNEETPAAGRLAALTELRKLHVLVASQHVAVKQTSSTRGNGSASAADFANPFLSHKFAEG